MTIRIFYLTKVVIVVLIATIVVSCRRDDINPAPLPEQFQLKRISEDSANYLQVEYAGDVVNRLKIMKDGFLLDYSFIYGTTGMIAEAILWGEYKLRFFYRAGSLIRVEYYNNLTTDELDGYTTFMYNDNKRLQVATNYYAIGSNSYLENAKTAYTYYPNGDVKTMRDSTLSSYPYNFVLEKQTNYEYDEKPNPLSLRSEILYALSLNNASHNVSKEIIYDAIFDVKQTNNFQLKYNKYDIPVSAVKTTIEIGKPSKTSTINYSY